MDEEIVGCSTVPLGGCSVVGGASVVVAAISSVVVGV